MNKLSIQRRTQVIKALVEGNSIPATYRMNDTAKGTVTRLLVDIGTACSRYQDEHLRNLTCRRIQCDEIWSFVYAKQKNVPTGMNGFAGDAWTWVSMCDDSKLVVSWLVGLRDAGYAYELMTDLAGRLSHRVQLTTDGLKSYLSAVEGAFGSNVDYAQLVKLYGEDPTEDKRRYSPAEWIASKPNVVQGNPDPAHISTSYIERQNLTMRMSMTRFTRSTNGPFAVRDVFVNSEPAYGEHEYTLERRHKANIQLSDVATAHLVHAGIADGFTLRKSEGAGQ